MSLRRALTTTPHQAHRPKHAKPSALGSVSDLAVPMAVGGVLTAGFVVGSAGGASAAASDDQLAGLRACESGGSYTTNTGNGYYGAYQFSAGTWHSLGYPGLPNQASPATQDAAVRTLQARSGWGQWPACSRQLGLSGGGGAAAPAVPAVARASRSSARTVIVPAITVVQVTALAYEVPKVAPLFDVALVITPTPAGGPKVFSPEVKAWQARMQQRGWQITPDGFYGPRSASVAQRFAAEKLLAAEPPGVLNKVVFDGAWSIPVT